MAVGAGGRVTSDAVNTFPTAVAVGKALTTLVEELVEVEVEVEDEELEGLTLLLDEDEAGLAEATMGLDEDAAGLTELLAILLTLDVGFNTVDVELFDAVEVLVDESLGVGLTELVTKAGVAVMALQT